MNRLFITTLILICSVDLFAVTRVFMFSRVHVDKKEVRLGDVARIEGEAARRLRALTVPDSVLHDNYIDRKEMSKILREELSGSFYLGGSGVKVLRNSSSNEKHSLTGTVRRGNLIKIVVKNKNINLEVYGTVVRDSVIGSTVQVKLPGGRKISGLLVHRRRVLVEL